MTTFITILMSILNLVMMNPNIPQETKDQIFSQTITAIEQGFKQEAPVQAPVQAPVTVSAPEAYVNEVRSTVVEPVATSTATTTQYVAGTVRTEGNKFIFSRNDADKFEIDFSITKGEDMEQDKVYHRKSNVVANVVESVEEFDVWCEGTLYMKSSKKGQVLGERTYNFKVENGVAQLY